ncbi:MAG TPA: PilZ domain-containing protein [Nitrospiraceae bacterium]|nr:PilZ domain-containing protein [Nitrospiraceae bacterium]
MKKQNKRFALRVNSPFPVQITMSYPGQVSAGLGIVQDLSRVGCRIVGNDPVVAGETLSLQLSHPTSEQPLIIEQAIVQ